jgi:hypothetical protein
MQLYSAKIVLWVKKFNRQPETGFFLVQGSSSSEIYAIKIGLFKGT